MVFDDKPLYSFVFFAIMHLKNISNSLEESLQSELIIFEILGDRTFSSFWFAMFQAGIR